MALQFVGYASGTGTGASYSVSLTALTGGIDTAARAGDLVVVAVGAGSANTNIACTATGSVNGAYDKVNTAATRANDTWDANLLISYKVMGDTPDNWVTVVGPNNAAYGGGAVVQVWRGANPVAPVLVVGTSAPTTNSSLGNPPAVTPTMDGCVVIAAGCGCQTTSGAAFTVPSGMTNGVSVKSDGTTSDTGVWMASAAGTNGVAYDPPAWTGGTTSTSSSAVGQSIVIAPAPVTVTGTSSGTPFAFTGTGAGSHSSGQYLTPSLRTAFATPDATNTKVLTGASWLAGDTILVFTVAGNSYDANSSCSAPGLSFTPIGVGMTGSSVSTRGFIAKATADGSGDITITSVNTNTCGVLALMFNDCAGTVASGTYSIKYDAAVANTRDTNTITVPENALVCTFGCQDSNSSTMTDGGTGFTEAGRVAPDAATVPQVAFYKVAGPGDVYQTVNTSAAVRLVTIIVALDPAEAFNGFTGTSSGTPFSITGTGSGVHGTTGASAGAPFAIGGSISAKHGVAGTSAGAPFTIGGSAAGVHAPPIAGTSAGTPFAITGSADGKHGYGGTSAGTPFAILGSIAAGHGAVGVAAGLIAVLTGTAIGSHGVKGTLAGTPFAVTGSAAGKHGYGGTSAGTPFTLAGSASGNFTQPSITGTSAGSPFTLSGSATGTHIPPVSGTSAGTPFTPAGSMSGAHGVAGTLAGSPFTLTGSAAGKHGVVGSMSGAPFAIAGSAAGNFTPAASAGWSEGTPFTFSGSMSGAHGVRGTSSGAPFTLTGSAAGTAVPPTVTGTSVGTPFQFTGSAAGTFALAAITGSSSGTPFILTGSAAGKHGIAGSSAGDPFTLTGSAAGNHLQPIQGTSSGAPFTFSGAGSGVHGVTGTSTGQLVFLGSIEAVHGVAGTSSGTPFSLTGSGYGSQAKADVVPENTCTVPVENREYVLRAEGLTYVVPEENRTHFPRRL